MILTASKITRIANTNPLRNYICIQNTNDDITHWVYLSQQDTDEIEVFLNTGFKLGAYGILEIPHCSNPKSKKPWYAYTEETGMDIRILEI
jgi:hypothetical protein